MTAKDNLSKAADGFQARLQRARDDQWDAPTPCTEWNVRALVNHVVGELRWVAPLLQGKTIAEVGDSLSGDLLGDDPKAAWNSAAEEAQAAVSAPGALERRVHLSYGDRQADGYINEVAGDVVVHTWDLARGIGGDAHLDLELVGIAQSSLTPEGLEGARSAGMFAAAVEVPADADPQTRLLALTGRNPGG